MTQVTLRGPVYNSQEFNTGDSTERGMHPKEIIDNLNAMLTEIYAQAGTTLVDFGAVPGAFDASATVTGQTNIAAGSIVDAWLVATATDDHSADEHWVDPPIVVAGAIVPGAGFTIYATTRNGNRATGKYTVNWKWL